MITRLGVMRHGSASMIAPSDALRPLTEFGEDEVHRAARVLPFEPSIILHSSLLRAQQTAAIVQSYFPLAAIKQVDFLIPENDPKHALNQLSNEIEGNVLIVSHQPLVSSLIGLAVEGSVRSTAEFGFLNPANFMVLEFEVFAAGCAKLVNTYLQ